MAHWSFCGMNCEECPVYQATQKQDQAHQGLAGSRVFE